MSESSNKLIKFWQELKRRKVFSVVTTYAATAYIIIEVTNNLAVPLHLPDWVITLILIILLIGLPVAVALSWIFDFTPQGLKKTDSLEDLKSKETVTKPIKSKLRTSYVLNAILIITVIILAYPKIFKPDSMERLRSSGERISVAVMPFQNMTNDTIWNVWQVGIQNEMITSLTNSEELKIRQTESINNLIQSKGLTSYASLTPSIARKISQNLDARIFVNGSIKQVGKTLRVNAQLIDSKSEDIFKSFQIDGTEDKIFDITDSLSVMIKDFLIMSKLIIEESPSVKKYVATTKNPEAFTYTISGNNEFYSKKDYPAAINMYMKAIDLDSNYIWPAFMISYAYLNQFCYDEGKKWLSRVYEKRDQMSVFFRTYVNVLHAIYFETHDESIKYMKQLLEIDDQLPEVLADIGYVYNLSEKYSLAIPELEKGLEIYKKWDVQPAWVYEYTNLGLAYHKTGQFKKEKQLYKKAGKDFPESPEVIFRQAVLSLTEGDTISANRYIEKYILLNRENLIPENQITTNLAGIYTGAGLLDKAEEYFRKALLSETENLDRINTLGYFLIDKDRDVDEGIALVEKAIEISPENFNYLHTKGYGLFKLGKFQESFDVLQKSWDLRMQNAIYDHEAFLHLEEAKKAVASQKNN